MKARNPGLIMYLRSNSRARILTYKHSLPRRLLFLIDGAVIFAAIIFVYFLRFNFDLSTLLVGLALKQSLLVFGVYYAFEIIFRSYAGLKDHTAIKDIFKVLIASACSFAVLMLLTEIGRRIGWQLNLVIIPRSILVLHFVLASIMLSAIRVVFKFEDRPVLTFA